MSGFEKLGFLIVILIFVFVFLVLALVLGLIVRFTRFAEGGRRAPDADRDQD